MNNSDMRDVPGVAMMVTPGYSYVDKMDCLCSFFVEPMISLNCMRRRSNYHQNGGKTVVLSVLYSVHRGWFYDIIWGVIHYGKNKKGNIEWNHIRRYYGIKYIMRYEILHGLK